MPLSPYVEEPLNSKVIKSFVPEQRSRYVFFEFQDSYVLSLWTFDVRFTHSHIMAMVQMSKKLVSPWVSSLDSGRKIYYIQNCHCTGANGKFPIEKKQLYHFISFHMKC